MLRLRKFPPMVLSLLQRQTTKSYHNFNDAKDVVISVLLSLFVLRHPE